MHTAGGQQALGEEEGNVGPGLEETPGGPGWAPPAAPVPTGLQYFFYGRGLAFKTLSFLIISEIQQRHDTASESSKHAFSTCAQDRIFIARFLPQEVGRLKNLQTGNNKIL